MLRETGCLNGVVTADASKSDEELVAMTKNWTIVGQDLLKVVSGLCICEERVISALSRQRVEMVGRVGIVGDVLLC